MSNAFPQHARPDLANEIKLGRTFIRKTPIEFHGPCPWCGGTDRFLVKLDIQKWTCRKCSDEKWGDVFDFIAKRDSTPLQDVLAQYKTSDFVPYAAKTPLPPTKAAVTDQYIYRDETGSVFGVKSRTEPKGFLWGSDRATGAAPLYNLPAVLSADADTLIWWVDGEKDVNTLTARGLIATSFADGMGTSWQPEFSRWLKGKHVVIIPDKDEELYTKEEDCAKAAAKSEAFIRKIQIGLLDAAASTTVLKLPGKGKDISDWLLYGGNLAELQTLATELRPREITTILDNTVYPGLDPKWLLAPSLVEFVETSHNSTGFPVEFFMSPVLAALSGAIGTSRILKLWENLEFTAAIWTCVVGDAGTGKTPTSKMALAPIYALESKWAEAYYKAQLEQKEAAKHRGKGEEPEDLIAKRILISDITIEAMASTLQDNPRGLLLDRDELSGWFKSFNQYKKSGDDRERWLSIWSSKSLIIDRKGNKYHSFVKRPFVAITGGTQPDKIKPILTGDEDGLVDRWLLFWPEAEPQYLEYKESVSTSIRTNYTNVIQRLVTLQESMQFDGEVGPTVLGFSPAAATLFQVKSRAVTDYARTLPPGPYRTAHSKAIDHAGRLCLVLHMAQVADGSNDKEVSVRTVEAAWNILHVAYQQLGKAYTHAEAPAQNREADALLQWMVKRNMRKCTIRELQRLRAPGCTKATEAKVLLDIMDNLGIGYVEQVKAGNKTQVWFTRGV